MALAFLFDEHLRGPLRQAILRHNLSEDDALDVVCVGDFSELSWGSTDAFSQDCRTMPRHLRQHLEAGRHSPGVLMVRASSGVRELLEMLILIDHAGQPSDFADAINYIP